MKWREQWQQWSEQLAREAQQMREQVDRDRQQIREKAQQGRKEQAEQYLEGRTADLLGQSYARAHYGVCAASMFPLPSARPARQGGRPRAPSPPRYNSDLVKFDRLIGTEGHNNAFRTRVRRFFRDTLGVPQQRAQMCGEVAELAVDYTVIGACLSLASSGSPYAVGAPYAAIALQERVIRGALFPIYSIANKVYDTIYKWRQGRANRENR